MSSGSSPRRLRRYGLLWLALIGLSLAIVVPPDIPVAGHSPLLAVGMATLGGAVGLALLQLGIVRFWTLGAPRDLCVGLAFGTLAVTNLVVRVAMPVLGVEPRSDAITITVLIAGAIAAVLFLLGLRLDGTVKRADRRRMAWWLGSLTLGTSVASIAVAAMLVELVELPRAIDDRARHLLDSRATIVDILPGQAPWLVAVNGVLGLVMLLAAAGFIRSATESVDLYDHVVAVALSLLAIGQLHALLYPPVDVDYVSVAGVFRLLAYVALLFGLVARIAADLTDRAAQDERLRLSRELHDGLAQHLGLLTLRLSRARELRRPAERRIQDLEAAARIVEVATLEARQAIVALRSGTMSWEELCAAVYSFADDFGRNHETSIDVTVSGSQPEHRLDIALRIEILRVLQEACSNAVRHGEATRIEVELAVGGAWLDLCIADDGRGFDPASGTTGAGLGLRSMRERAEACGGDFSLDAAPGRGVAVRARLPLAGPGRTWR